MREALEASLVVPVPAPRPRLRKLMSAAIVCALACSGYVGLKLAPSVEARFADVPPATADMPTGETTVTNAAVAATPVAIAVAPGETPAAPVIEAVPPTESEATVSVPTVAAATDTKGSAESKAEKDTKSAKAEKAESRPHDNRALDLKRLTEARAQAKAKPGDAQAMKKWATAAYAAGDYRESRHATEAWALRERSPEPRLFLARVLDTLGKRAEARSVLQEVLELHPDLAEARKMVGKMGSPMATPDAPTTRPKVARK